MNVIFINEYKYKYRIILSLLSKNNIIIHINFSFIYMSYTCHNKER